MSTVGLIGIGDLGLAIAKNLIARGHEVWGFRRSSMDALVAVGGKAGASPRDVAERSEVVLTCLPAAQALVDVVSGPEGLAAARKPNLTVFELSTLPLSAKERGARLLKEVGARVVESPAKAQ